MAKRRPKLKLKQTYKLDSSLGQPDTDENLAQPQTDQTLFGARQPSKDVRRVPDAETSWNLNDSVSTPPDPTVAPEYDSYGGPDKFVPLGQKISSGDTGPSQTTLGGGNLTLNQIVTNKDKLKQSDDQINAEIGHQVVKHPQTGDEVRLNTGDITAMGKGKPWDEMSPYEQGRAIHLGQQRRGMDRDDPRQTEVGGLDRGTAFGPDANFPHRGESWEDFQARKERGQKQHIAGQKWVEAHEEAGQELNYKAPHIGGVPNPYWRGTDEEQQAAIAEWKADPEAYNARIAKEKEKRDQDESFEGMTMEQLDAAEPGKTTTWSTGKRIPDPERPGMEMTETFETKSNPEMGAAEEKRLDRDNERLADTPGSTDTAGKPKDFARLGDKLHPDDSPGGIKPAVPSNEPGSDTSSEASTGTPKDPENPGAMGGGNTLPPEPEPEIKNPGAMGGGNTPPEAAEAAADGKQALWSGSDEPMHKIPTLPGETPEQTQNRKNTANEAMSLIGTKGGERKATTRLRQLGFDKNQVKDLIRQQKYRNREKRSANQAKWNKMSQKERNAHFMSQFPSRGHYLMWRRNQAMQHARRGGFSGSVGFPAVHPHAFNMHPHSRPLKGDPDNLG